MKDRLDKLNREIHLNFKAILQMNQIREKDIMELLDLSKGSANRLINGHRPVKLSEIYLIKEAYLPEYSFDDLIKARFY